MPNHDCVDTTLKYFRLAKPVKGGGGWGGGGGGGMGDKPNPGSQDNEHSSIDDVIITFVKKSSEPMIINLIAKVNDAMQETSPVLSAFNLFNLETTFKDVLS